jgi:thiamine pyrophosphate-dependent acetolactate synthase large subunit-like protein
MFSDANGTSIGETMAALAPVLSEAIKADKPALIEIVVAQDSEASP